MSGSYVGVLGGGQLGRMLALAGYPLGLRFRFLDPTPGAPVSYFAEQYIGDYHDTKLLERFAASLNVITYEFENVPVDAAQWLERIVPVHPTPQALEVSQDRLIEKTFLRRCKIPTADFVAIENFDDLRAAIQHIGLPAVLKTRRMGYDGKGQVVIRMVSEAEGAWRALGGTSLILEQYMDFNSELSILAVRDKTGKIIHYPLMRNWHHEGILRKSIPINIGESIVGSQLEDFAVSYIETILMDLDYIGVLTLELFEVNGLLLVNEMAPRVHNSGHWTIEGSVTSQFENHLRAILGLPLGSTRTIGYPAMLNVIGSIPDVQRVMRSADAHLHVYGKAPRPGRKLGHITIQARTAKERDEQITAVEQLLTC